MGDEAYAAAADLLDPPTPTHLPDPQDHQRHPDGDWSMWLLKSGRGAGKSWAAMRWLALTAHQRPGLRARIIGPTLADVVSSCVRGPSGLLIIDADARGPVQPQGEPLQVQWPNGSVAYLVGTPTRKDVDRLRAVGNVHVDVYEEAAANPQLTAMHDQATLSRRLENARCAVSTTPRPLALVKEWTDDPDVPTVTATSHDNKFADPQWLAKVEATYKGTHLYRQEILGEIVDEVAGALWSLSIIDDTRVGKAPEGARWAVGVDPAVGTGTTGIVAVALHDGHLYVTDDVSTVGGPQAWAGAVRELAHDLDATVVAETNQGGTMVTDVLRQYGVDVPVKTVRAAKGKRVRAEPVSLHWHRQPPTGHMVGVLPHLEDQLSTWDGTGASPDRLDAMVHAATWLTTSAGGPMSGSIPSGRIGGL